MQGYLVYGIIALLSVSTVLSLLPGKKIGMWINLVAGVSSFLLAFILWLRDPYYSWWFYGDFITRTMLIVITLTYLLAVLHSSICLRDIKEFYLPQHYYWALLSLFALTMVLAVSSPNIGYAWFWLEASTIVSAALILVERGKNHVESAWRYILIASAGLGMALLSIIIFGWSTGTFIWVNTTVTQGVAIIGVLALLGFGAKAGLFPVHTWLPDAHGTAPSPVSAMLSGALLPSALIVYYRLFSVLHSEILFHLTVIVGLLTLWVAGFLMLSQNRFKRLLAYSSMDVMGIAMIGIALSFMHNEVMRYVLILFIAHALGKSALFLAAGVLKRMGYEEISDIRNLGSSPLFALAVVLGALTVTGAPPFPMFFGEFGIVVALAGHIYAFIALLGGILLSFLALNYHVLRMVFEKDDKGIEIDAQHSAVPLLSSLAAVALTIVLYVWGWLI